PRGGSKLMKELADVALQTARSQGAQYADIRINKYRQQSLFSREDRIQNAQTQERLGFGVRVLVDGVWGFAAASRVSKDHIARIAGEAVKVAKANAMASSERVELVPVPRVVDTWQT